MNSLHINNPDDPAPRKPRKVKNSVSSTPLMEPVDPAVKPKRVYKTKTGRPKIIIDYAMAAKLCTLFCTQEEICSFLHISIDTLERGLKADYKISFAEFFKEYSARGRVGLRRKQYLKAMQGSNSMLIWLGKQFLGQRDTPAEVIVKDLPELKITIEQ